MKYDPFYQTVAWESYLGFVSSLETGPASKTQMHQGNFYIVTYSINNGWHQREVISYPNTIALAASFGPS